MNRAWLALTAVTATVVWGAPPSYSAASIVNAGNYSSGPFAPNSILTIFGSGLARSTAALSAADIADGYLPTELNYTRVFVDNSPAPLWYVSDGQINFLLPSTQSTGDVKIRVAREGVSGPEAVLQVVDAAPALFALPSGYAIATDAKGVLLTADAPAKAGDVIVIYLTGLGKTKPNPAIGFIPRDGAWMVLLNDLRIKLNGTEADAARIQYAGLTPGCAGLYQINLALPESLESDPELRVSVGTQTSTGGLKLPVR